MNQASKLPSSRSRRDSYLSYLGHVYQTNERPKLAWLPQLLQRMIHALYQEKNE